MLLTVATDWFKDNKDKLTDIAVGEIDYYPPNGDDSFSFGFESKNFVYQIVIWNEGYIKFLRLNKQTMTEEVENTQVKDSNAMVTILNDYLIEILMNNAH